MNALLRAVAAALALCLAASAANDYFGLGWFGGSARLVNAVLMLATVMFLVVARRLWRNGK
jgi:hypothetical protein